MGEYVGADLKGNVLWTTTTNTTENWVQSVPMYMYPCTISIPSITNIGVEEKKMRGLFSVYIVDPETDGIQYKESFIAKDETSAKMKAYASLKLDKDADEYDFVVVRLGNVRCKKEISEVRIAK
jgi:hypothetical protein